MSKSDGVSFCPLAIVNGLPFYRTNAWPQVAAQLKDAGVDGLWANWEPHRYAARGCICHRCLEAFARYLGKPVSEVAHGWPTNSVAYCGGCYAVEARRFRSHCHGEVVKAIDREVRALTGGKDSLGLIPGVHYRQLSSTVASFWMMRDAMCEDYAGSMAWVNPWGPYVAWKRSQPYVKQRARNLASWVAATDMRRFVDATYPLGKRPRLMAAPAGLNGGCYLRQPEQLELDFDVYFFNRFEATCPWEYPAGADARFWQAFANATGRAAKYEDVVIDGVCVSDAFSIAPVAEYGSSVNIVLGQFKEATDVSPLQFVAYARDGLRLVAVFNCWEDGEAFFTLKGELPDGDYELVSDDGVQWIGPLGRRTWTAAELAEGVFLSVGACRCRVFEFRPSGAGDHSTRATAMRTESDCRADYAARKAVLAEAARRDREYAERDTKGVTADE